MERYYVATTTGYLADRPSGESRGPGVSVMVLDRAYNHRLVWGTRSEDVRGGLMARRRDEAVRRAEVVAAWLNASRPLVNAVRAALPHATFQRWRASRRKQL